MHLKQETPESERLKINVIKGGGDIHLPHYINSNQGGNILKEIMDNDHKHSFQTDVFNPSCIDCGILFSSPLDVYKHTRKGCNEQPPSKMIKVDDSEESEDDSGLVNLINEAYEEYDDVYGVKVQQNEQERCSNEEPKDLSIKYKEYLMDVYQNPLMSEHNVQGTSLHRQIINDVDYRRRNPIIGIKH